VLFMIESLESRQLLSGNVATFTSEFAEISIHTDIHLTHAGTLAIKGTDGADSLSVIRKGKFINYQTNNGGNIANFFTEASKVKRVLVEAGSGDDRVFVDPNLLKACTVVGGNGNDRIDGNLGATLIGGMGNDRLFAHPPGVLHVQSLHGEFVSVGTTGTVGNAVLSGGAGNDTLIGNEGDDFVGGTGVDRAVLYLPDSDPKIAGSDGSVGGRTLSDVFTDATGLEILSLQVGTGEDAVSSAIYTLMKGTAGGG
jgi:Ca2+-binding RTX toxin-like protein